MLCRVKDSTGNAWTKRVGGAVRSRDPTFSQSERKDEDIEFLDGPPNCREMLLPISPVFRHRGEAVRLNLGPERIDDAAVRAQPSVFFGTEQVIGTIQQLQQLARSINVAIARRENPITIFFGYRRWHERMGRFGYEITETGTLQMPRDVLGKTTAGRSDTVRSTDAKLTRNDGVDPVKRRLRDCPLPKVPIR